MNRLYSLLLLALLSVAAVFAVPAHKGSVRITQPDGSTVTIRLHGDEYRHFSTTDDGYSVVRNAQGYYVYARLDTDGQLQPTTVVAHDRGLRQADEHAFLSGTAKYLTPAMTAERSREQQAERRRQRRARERHRAQQYDYANFRGLVILVEFSDKSFSRTDYKDVMDKMINEENYTGYTATNGRKQNFVGSVRDYYSDQSSGLFQPQFDVVGPYKVNYRANQGSQRSMQILNAALNAADADINFADYDRDDDGVVDMVYFIVAGNGSNYSGNDEGLWWPHRSVIYSGYSYVHKDGVYLWDYASSVELAGYTSYPSSVTIDGIGTICHEFSHVLGLPDFYDTDYAESGGESHHPAEWSVMAGGSYNNNGRQPVGYSLFERYAVGFATPQTVDAEGSYTLDNLTESNTGYRINTPVSHEFFILENRQQDRKWNAYLPGHGMLVYRVDSTSAQIWENNAVNNNPSHNYYELLRAAGYQGRSLGSDAFPGTRHVTTLNNETTPANLLTWAGKETPWGLDNIKEENGVVTFDVVNVNVLKEISLPAEGSVGLGMGLQLKPKRYPESAPFTLAWSSSDEAIATVSADGLVTGVAEGQATITVVANDNPQLSASCLVAVHPTIDFTSIAEYKTLATGNEASLTLADARVLMVHGDDIYVGDSSGAIVINGWTDNVPRQGDWLSGTVYGVFSKENRVPHLTVPAGATVGLTAATSDAELEPRQVSLDSLSEADYADYILLDKVVLSSVTTGPLTGVYAQSEDSRVRIYNTFGLKGFTMPRNYQGKTYSVPGILVTRKVGDEVFDELALMGPPEELVKKTFSVDYAIGQGGALLYDGEPLMGNGSLQFTEGDNAEFVIAPSDDYELERVYVDGEYHSDHKVVLNDISANHTIDVTFAAVMPSAIAAHTAAASAAETFSLDGRRVGQPSRPGLYLVRSGSTMRKVIVRPGARSTR